MLQQEEAEAKLSSLETPVDAYRIEGPGASATAGSDESRDRLVVSEL